MGYMVYDRSLYRTGFRPYGTTNPKQAAAGLSGMTTESGPFGPWRLRGDFAGLGHDLGQVHPFTERGGWPLHGMAGLGDAGIPAGSVLTYQGTWSSVGGTVGVAPDVPLIDESYLDPQSIISAVVGALNSDGQLTVLQAPTSASTGFLNQFFGQSAPFSVQLVVQVTNGQGFGSVNDVISIIRHYVYSVTGQFPSSDSISKIAAPQGAPGPGGGTAPNYQIANLLNPGGVQPAAPPGSPETFSDWMTKNGALLAVAALGIGAVVLLRR